MKCGGENILLLMSAMLCGIGLYATPDGVAAQMFALLPGFETR